MITTKEERERWRTWCMPSGGTFHSIVPKLLDDIDELEEFKARLTRLEDRVTEIENERMLERDSR